MKTVGFFSAVSIIIASMIGTGVFTTSGFAVQSLGDPRYVILAWLVGGFVALMGAVCYSALGLIYGVSGGEYLVISRGLHPIAGFLAGWVSLFAGFSAPIAASALALEAYLQKDGSYWLGASVIILSGLIHGVSVGRGLKLQSAAVFFKIFSLSVFVIWVFSLEDLSIQSALSSESFKGWAPFFINLIWISFSYSGWNALLYIFSELKNPHQDLLKASIVAVSLVTIFYVILNSIFVLAVPTDLISGQADVATIVAEKLGGKGLKLFLSLTIGLALITSISSMIMVGPRVYAQMAEDGLFPRFFKWGHRGPVTAIGLQVCLALALFFVSSLREIMTYAGYLLSFSTAMAVFCTLLDYKKAKPLIPFFPLPPIIFLSLTLATTVFLIVLNPMQAFYGFLTLFVGLVFYLLMNKSNKCERRIKEMKA